MQIHAMDTIGTESAIDAFAAEFAYHLALSRDGSKPLTVSAASLAGKPIPQREWLVEGTIPHKQVTLLYGDGGVGKSLLAMQLAVSVATGNRWVGLSVEKGKAMYLGAEDDQNEMHSRFAAILDAADMEFTDLGDLYFRSLLELNSSLLVEQKKDRVEPTALYTMIKRELESHRPRLLVLDTLANLFGGNEIDRAQVTSFGTMLKRLAMEYGCAIVLLAHPSKSGMESRRGDSGSTAWNNVARSRLYLEFARGEDADPRERILSLKKNNYGPLGHEYALLVEDGVLKLQGAESTLDKAAMDAKAKRVFRKLLRERNEQGRYVNDKYAASEFADDPESEGITKRKFAAAKALLFREGTIKVDVVRENGRNRNILVCVGD